MVKKHFTKYLEISKREIRMFTFINSNFEMKTFESEIDSLSCIYEVRL